MAPKHVAPETICLLAQCLAWLFSYRPTTIDQLTRYMKSIMLEAPEQGFIQNLFESYCSEVEKKGAKPL
jgi:hypothetical protein